MIKSVVAAAVMLALSGVAQAADKLDLSISGRVAAYVESIKEGTAARDEQQTSDITWITVKASQDLGGGLKANIVARTRLLVDDPALTKVGGDRLTVGLSNALGSVDLGRNYHALGTATIKYDVVWTDYGSHYDDIHSAQNRRLSNGVFATVNLGPNVKVQYDRGDNIVTGVTDVNVYSAHAKLGALSGSVLRYDDGANNETTAVGLEYKLAATGTTLVGFYSDDTQNGVETKGKSLGVRQQLGGPWSATVGYGTNDDAKSYVGGLTYNFTKDAMVHARFTKLDHDVAAKSREQFGLGLEVWF
jgi:hypothetical protein